MASEDENRDDARHGEHAAAGAEAVPPDKAAADLRAECERLREEVRRLKQERDEYHHQLCHLLGEYFDAVHGKLTEEKLLDMIANEKWYTLDEIIDEVELIGKKQ